MSFFSVPVVKLGKVGKHPNADSLSITQVEGCPCIFRTGDFNPEDVAIYVPVESVVPLNNSLFSFLSNPNKPNQTTSRIKAKKLRGIFSMGILVKAPEGSVVGTNMAESLGIVKWEEPEQISMNGENEKDPGFIPQYDIESYRKYKYLIESNEEVYVSEKLHGTQFRAGYREGQLYVGSHRCIKRFNESNLYWKAAVKYDLESKLKNHPGLVIFGEVYGSVQDLKYGCNAGEFRLAVFDLYDATHGRFLDYKDFKSTCEELNLPTVPCLYVGPFDPDKLEPLCNGKSTIANNIREGWVLKPTKERWCQEVGRVIVKLVGENYLLRSGGTEGH